MSSTSLESNKIVKATTIPQSSVVALNTLNFLSKYRIYFYFKLILLIIVFCLYVIILLKSLFATIDEIKYKIPDKLGRFINISAEENEFTERRQVLWDTCLKRKIVGKYPPNAWEFFISPRHGITWCNVFKAASSTWLYYFSILGGYPTRQLQNSSRTPLELARDMFPRPNSEELSEALINSLSFLVVREPFERLVSAYKSKLETKGNIFYSHIGNDIVYKVRKTANVERNLRGPTFKEFLLYLVDLHKNGGHFDEHWAPVYTFCTPCSINFTLVSKFDTFQRDTEYIIRLAGLESLLLNKLSQFEIDKIRKRSSNNDTKSLVPLYFSQIDENLLRDVLEIYEIDFELFDYNSTKYFEYVQPAPPRKSSSSFSLSIIPTAITNQIITFTIIFFIWIFCHIIPFVLRESYSNPKPEHNVIFNV